MNCLLVFQDDLTKSELDVIEKYENLGEIPQIKDKMFKKAQSFNMGVTLAKILGECFNLKIGNSPAVSGSKIAGYEKTNMTKPELDSM